MIGAIVRAVLVAVIATLILAGVLQLAPTQRPLALAIYLLAMGGVAVHLLHTWLRLLYPRPPASPFDTALAARPAPPRPPAAWPGCSPWPAPAPSPPTPGSGRSCGRSPPTCCAGRWPSTWTATPTPPGPPSASPGGRCSPATSATCPPGRRPGCPRATWPG